MKATTLLTSLRTLAAGLAISLCSAHVQAAAPAVSQYLIAKGQAFMQTNAGLAVLSTNDPFQGMISLEPSSPTSVTSVRVQIPGGEIVMLETNEFDSQWEFKDSFASKAAMDAVARPGAYRFTIIGSDGTNTPTLTLSADAYPNTPHLANWSALQSADASGDILITWDAFVGGTTNDFVQFQVQDEMGNGFSSGENPGQPGALNGTSTSIVIPANTLAAGSNFIGTLLFARTTINTTSYPGAQGIAAYFKETSFQLVTATTPPAAGRVRFAEAAYSVNENAGIITLTVLRTGGTSGSISVSVSTRAGSAMPGDNYGGGPINAITWGDGENDVKDVPIIVAGHPTFDGNKNFFVTLSDPTGGADLGYPTEATVTILDNEIRGAGTFGFSAPSYPGLETASNVSLTITRTGGTTGVVSIFYSTVPGSAEAGSDFASTATRVYFSNGVSSRVINIPLIRDDHDETNESFGVSLDLPTGGAALNPNNTATVVIKDDDTAGTLAFSAPVYSVTEADTNLAVIVRRLGGQADEVSVDLVITGGTASRGNDPEDDYEHAGGSSVTLHFGAGQTAVTNLFAIADDRAAEGDETITLSLSNPAGGATLRGVTNAMIKILDDEVTLQFTASSYTNRESVAVALAFVERSGPVGIPAFVTVRTTSGSATPGLDYFNTNILVSFKAGEKKKPVGIRIINDFLVENDETIGLLLQDPSDNALLGPTNAAVLHVVSDDLGGVIQFATTNINVLENRAFVPVTVTRTGGLASNVTFRLETTDESADDGDDYVETNVTFSFAAREVKKVINIPILPDTLAEGTETFRLDLSSPEGGGSLGVRSRARIAILDDDQGGIIGFARAEILVNENGTNAIVIVNRAGGAASEVKVRLAAANGTATGPDYGSFDRDLTFAAGETSKTNLIRIDNDVLAEGTETINLTLREFEGGGRPGLTNAVIKIIDDESSVAFTTNAVAGFEGSSVTLTVLRAGALTTTVTVDYMTVAGTATETSDYATNHGTLTFGPNQPSKTITIALTADPVAESNETFTVILKDPTGGTLLGAVTNVVVTIKDKPDPAAIPIEGPVFLSARIGGAAFNPTPALVNMVYETNAFGTGIPRIANFVSTVYSVGGSVGSTVIKQLTMVVSPGSPGVVTLDNTTTHGLVTWSVTQGATGRLWAVADGSSSEGSGGTFTIDAVDTVAKKVSGRFNIQAREVTDGGANGFITITGSFRAAYF